MVFSSNKAMSPLIATVLLIAFAVALGAMIMNWSAGVSPEDGYAEVNCKDVSLSSTTQVCYTDNQLTFSLKNDGKARIDGVLLRINDEFGDTQTTLRDSALISGESLQGHRPYAYTGGSFKLTFVPLKNSASNQLEACESGSVTQITLPTC